VFKTCRKTLVGVHARYLLFLPDFTKIGISWQCPIPNLKKKNNLSNSLDVYTTSKTEMTYT
jgi:hypothetical protein